MQELCESGAELEGLLRRVLTRLYIEDVLNIPGDHTDFAIRLARQLTSKTSLICPSSAHSWDVLDHLHSHSENS